MSPRATSTRRWPSPPSSRASTCSPGAVVSRGVKSKRVTPDLPGPARKGSQEMAVHRIVIVGAGFAGLKLAHDLKGAPVEITVIDQRNHHLFQPLLYQVATTLLATSEIAWPIRRIFRNR